MIKVYEKESAFMDTRCRCGYKKSSIIYGVNYGSFVVRGLLRVYCFPLIPSYVPCHTKEQCFEHLGIHLDGLTDQGTSPIIHWRG